MRCAGYHDCLHISLLGFRDWSHWPISSYLTRYLTRLGFSTSGWIGHKVIGTSQSLNRPLLVSRRRFIFFLKTFNEVDSTASTLRLFHLLMTRSEKKCCLRSELHLFFTNFNGCPRVRWSFFSSKSLSNGIFVRPLCILKTSIRSDLFRLFSSTAMKQPPQTRAFKLPNRSL